MSASAPVEKLVGEPRASVRDRTRLAQLQLLALRNLPGPDEAHHLACDPDQLVVAALHLTNQLRLILSDEAESVEVISELHQLTDGGIQRPLLGDEQRVSNAIQLASRIVLELAIGRHFALQRKHFHLAMIGLAQRPQANRPDCDEEHRDGKERRQQLGMNASRYARDQARHPVGDPELLSRHAAHTSIDELPQIMSRRTLSWRQLATAPS